MANDDDSQATLHEISRRYNSQPIVSLLLAIQREGYCERQVLNSSFLRQLECFSFDSTQSNMLRRKWINAFKEPDYVALSYTWQPSQYESSKDKGYLIQNRKRTDEFKSPVRDSVFQRIERYMKAKGVELLWIDRHSIKQGSDEEAISDRKKALDCMDWVYKLSEHPVALLGRPLKSPRELELLHTIWMEELNIKPQMTNQQYEDVTDALRLLYEITDDSWWKRAWTFQENYKGGKEMTLLIPHPHQYESRKKKLGVFENVPGELCVKSQEFSTRLTNLCVKARSTLSLTGEMNWMINSILSRAGRYNVLLQESQTMSPTIIADVEKRGVAKVWDRLPIVGNCCSYPVRMDIELLQKRGHSLSLSMLAMCLLNGEMLNNAMSDTHTSLNLTTSSFLKTRTFNRITPPEEENSLTFNKGCRFIHVELNENGILTRGHLWKLGRTIYTARFSRSLPWVRNTRARNTRARSSRIRNSRIRNSRGSLTLLQRRCLTRLCQSLIKYRKSRTLAKYIILYLDGDANGNADFEFGENYMRMMMNQVAKAIKAGKELRLGSLGDSHESTAVFICDGDRTGDFVFTSSRAKKTDHEDFISNDIDNHVSVVVDLTPDAEEYAGNPPFLYVKRWALGICFFVGCEREEVVFPWPRALAGE